ncbi:MAG: hypothetical protein IJZ79_01360 [Bacilli bacterium]|nr:hypothetical protein [Bacilli bacterium]
MKNMQEFHLKQTYHEITFYAYDIEKIEIITPEHLSKVFIPECSKVNGHDNDCKPNNMLACVNCQFPHFQELLIDGWYVGNKYGQLTDNCYVAYLQTGIRVPVNKEVYEAWLSGFSDEPRYSSDSIYEL